MQHAHTRVRLVAVALAALCALSLPFAVTNATADFSNAATQERGRLKGRVVNADGSPAPGRHVVVAVDQVTGRRASAETAPDGSYELRLRAGSYRVRLQPPSRANFTAGKDYGPLAIPRGEAVENVHVEPGVETKLDIPLRAPEANAPTPTATPAGEGDDPLGYAGASRVEDEEQTRPDRQSVRDRWRIGFPEYDRYGDRGARGRDIQFRRGRWYDPYNQSVLKGDYPVIGQKVFMVLSATSTSFADFGRTPKPTGASAEQPVSAEFFGRPEALAFNQFYQLSFELFHGDTVFRPRDWAIKISPTFSAPNYLNARERGVVNIDPRRGTDRTDWHVSLEEAFAEVKLRDVNENFDFVSVRAGIQPFVSDFRGFVFTDNNLGLRLFGGLDNNRYQWNAAAFAMLEKDTNSGLNRFDRRQQNVYVANFFRQDFLKKGYTGQISLLFNDDRRSVEFDRNGFQVRPAVVGDARPHSVKVGYLGLNGDGHVGRLNLTNSYYLAIGRDDRNPIAGRPTRIRAHMGAVEASYDKDYQRFRASFFFASGDKNPTDARASGFDAILDDPNFAGGQFSFWNRQGIRLTQTGVALVEPNSLLPSLRSSKTQGQANFVNPGLFIYNAGYDVEVTQRLKAVFNLNYLRFHRTEPLEYVLFQNRIRKEIGYDLSVGVAYRPLLINNVTFTFGGAVLRPGRGFRDIYTDASRNCPANVRDFCDAGSGVINPSRPLYSVFAQAKFVF